MNMLDVQRATQCDRAEEWTREALRLHRRYEREIVDALILCPWARRARATGAIKDRVLLQEDHGDLQPSLEALEEFAGYPHVELVFLIYPRLALGRRAFEDFAAELRTADAAHYAVGRVPFVAAVFHPDAEPDTTDPERLIPFLRKTPDPTLQFVRAQVLEGVRSSAPQGTQFVDPATLDFLGDDPARPPLRSQVARANLEAVRRLGVDEVSRRFLEIRDDRDRTYDALRRGP
jgi:hypothetical protein